MHFSVLSARNSPTIMQGKSSLRIPEKEFRTDLRLLATPTELEGGP